VSVLVRAKISVRSSLTDILGGKCGSTAIDRNFYQLVSERFGHEFEKLPPKKRGLGSTFMDKWESAKKNFGITDANRTHLFYLEDMDAPDSIYYDRKDQEIRITRSVSR
jgi:hypothetical protein